MPTKMVTVKLSKSYRMLLNNKISLLIPLLTPGELDAAVNYLSSVIHKSVCEAMFCIIPKKTDVNLPLEIRERLARAIILNYY